MDAAGKTSFVQAICGSKHHEDQSKQHCTLESSKCTRRYTRKVGGRKITFYDVPGCKQFRRQLWPQVCQRCHSIIFIVDASDIDRLMIAAKELEAVVRKTGSKPVLVVANKKDVAPAMTINLMQNALSRVFSLPSFSILQLSLFASDAGDAGLGAALDSLSAHRRSTAPIPQRKKITRHLSTIDGIMRQEAAI